MRFALVFAAIALPAIANAQPGPDSQPPQAPPPGPGPYAPPPGQYAPPGYGPPAPYAYQPSPDEQELLAEGYIDPMRTAVGGAAAFVLGFGIGQGIEGRWHDTGWIFTLGETASLAAIIGGAVGIANCTDLDGNTTCGGGDSASVGWLVGGLIAYTGLHIWEVVDAFIGPSYHNDRVHELRRRYGYRDYATHIVPYVTRPQSSEGGMTAGLALTF
jgi:hypothetical protein